MIGFGYDIHRFEDSGTGFMLGGVWIPAMVGVVAHSDGDVVLHALCDAMLGAAGLGDIGQHFPDTDAQYKGAPSWKFVERIVELLRDEGLRLVNADMTIVLERPKIMPYKDEMRRCIASVCKLDVRRVSIKATTNESVGCIGRGEAVAAFAVCMVEPVTG